MKFRCVTRLPAIANIMANQIIDELGFKFMEGKDVKGRLSISDLYPKSKSRCGIYLLSFNDDTYYIGQALDFVRRFSQHRKTYDNIRNCWFQPIKKINLDDVEKRLIQSAELNGLLLINKVYISNIIGETDLDLVISPKEQEDWLINGLSISDEGIDLYNSVEPRHILKYRNNFQRFLNVPNYQEIKNFLKSYILKCIPCFKKTELSFWSLSCLSSTNANTSPRYICLNINGMEVLVIGYNKKTKTPFCFIVVTQSWAKKNTDINNLKKRYKGMEYIDGNYRTAGLDQITLHFNSLEDLQDLINTQLTIVQSIKEMNMRLMRKGGTIFSVNHCFDLAHDVLS